MTATIWFIAAVALFVIEILTPGVFFFACLGIGALASAVLFLFLPSAWITWVVFVVFSVASMYFIRPFAVRYFQGNAKKSNVDALIGQKALVTEDINPPALGMVKVAGETWRAEAKERIEKNTWTEIVRVEGTHLEVKKT